MTVTQSQDPDYQKSNLGVFKIQWSAWTLKPMTDEVGDMGHKSHQDAPLPLCGRSAIHVSAKI